MDPTDKYQTCQSSKSDVREMSTAGTLVPRIFMLLQSAAGWGKNSTRHLVSPIGPMQDEKNQPANECNQAAGKGNEHEPTHYAE